MPAYDPRGKVNRALLVGVSEYDVTEPPHGVPGDLPAVKHNVNRLRDVLTQGRVFGEHEVRAVRSPSLDEFNHALRTVVQESEGLLLLYFAGHGAIPMAGHELFLQMRNASVIAGAHAVFPGAEMFTTVLSVLATSRAERIVVVLDCCFAGNAGSVWEDFRDKRRVLLLTSVQANHRIDAGDPRTPTPFTEHLARLLDRDEQVWFGELSRELRQLMSTSSHRTVRGDPWDPRGRAEPDEDVLLSARKVPSPPPPPPAPLLTPTPPPPLTPTPVPPSRTQHPVTTPVLRRTREALRTFVRTCAAAVVTWIDRFWPVSGTATRITLVLALAAAGLGSYGIYTLAAGSPSCGPPLELRLLTDPDLESTVRAASDAYLTSDANTTGDGCRRSGITVYSAGAADAVTALHRQSAAWQEPRDPDTDPQRDVGPQPDIWIPASAADAERVTAHPDPDSVVTLTPDSEPFAYSPLVLAVPEHIAAPESLRTGHQLNELIDELRGRDSHAEVARPDPEFTDAALLATMGLYRDAAQPDTAEGLVRQPGPPSPTAADLLCTLPDDDTVDNRTAALVPEFLLKSGVGCDRTTRSRRIAEYPDDTSGIEPTYVRVGWQGATRDQPARDAAAEDFHTWLTGNGGLAVFAADGFRSATGDRVLLDTRSVAPGVERTPGPVPGPNAVQMDVELAAYRGANGPGRVLFLIDDSGSMEAHWEGASGGPGLLKQSLGGFGSKDEYGVWGVSGLTGGHFYTELISFAPHHRADAEKAIDKKAEVQDAEADPHTALLAALDYMAHRGTDDEHPRLIVYVTDDEDNNRLTGAGLDAVLKKARSVKVPVAMVSLVSGGCDKGKPDAQVSDASGGRCLDADEDLGAGLQDEVARTGMGDD
ncbi:substrate-binding domain-containing protein [Streptomyces sp. NBC_01478]|uniref:substrate-binding domain-containing protein n=1 Tax=Streptomyces sp. NBC_01478 TaxID=2903882 RepID=UPI002E3485B5|nr:substrate-binding domain-containing protein [Streptomyces sp. NBC_01478]